MESGEPGVLRLHLGVDGLCGRPLVVHGHPLELAQQLPVHGVRGRPRLKRNVSHSSSQYESTTGEVSLVLSHRVVPLNPAPQNPSAAEALDFVGGAHIEEARPGQVSRCDGCTRRPGVKSSNPVRFPSHVRLLEDVQHSASVIHHSVAPGVSSFLSSCAFHTSCGP